MITSVAYSSAGMAMGLLEGIFTQINPMNTIQNIQKRITEDNTLDKIVKTAYASAGVTVEVISGLSRYILLRVLVTVFGKDEMKEKLVQGSPVKYDLKTIKFERKARGAATDSAASLTDTQETEEQRSGAGTSDDAKDEE